MSFWCITTVFNPCGYRSIINNYHIFKQSLDVQKVNLLTLELTFGNAPELPDAIHIHCDSVMWQKERLINLGKQLLPDGCDSFAWLDADIVFDEDDWAAQAQRLLSEHDIIQLFKRVHYLPRGDVKYCGNLERSFYSVVWQSRYENWLTLREEKRMPFGAPGFAWAARMDSLELYDKDIVGSGDCILVDSLLGTWKLHDYEGKFNDKTKEDIQEWHKNKKRLSVGYLPVDIFHLWHGNLRNRNYMKRHRILLDNDFDPKTDVKIKNGVYEWATEKAQMHAEMEQYFFGRRDDD